jgi:predicted DNA-binding transcriptional regulator AlpA
MSTGPENLRLIGPTELAKRLGRSTMFVWRLEKAGILPPRIKLGPHTRKLWRLRDIEVLLDQRAGERAPT